MIDLRQGDCLEKLKDIEDNSVDMILTDAPYEIGFMSRGWDNTGIAFNVDLWKDALRVLKPGGYLMAFSGTRTYHRMAVAIEDAGFEVKDMIEWMYGSGFPKAHDISKAIDKKLGKEREIIGEKMRPDGRTMAQTQPNGFVPQFTDYKTDKINAFITAPASDIAKQYDGYKTQLKPSHEPICLAMKPLSEKNFADNVMKWGTGGLNIEKSRIKQDDGILQQKILDFSNICNAGDDIPLLSLCCFDEFSSSSLLVCQGYLKHISSVLATYNNFYIDLLHNEVSVDGKNHTQYLDEFYDYGHFAKSVVQYVCDSPELVDFLNDYPILYRLYDELSHWDTIHDQDVAPLLNDVLACISHFRDLQENNLDNNILRLVSFLVVGFSIKTHLLNSYFLHYIQSTCKSQLNEGRYPANLIIHENIADVLDKQSGYSKSRKGKIKGGYAVSNVFTGYSEYTSERGHEDEGGASRYFKNIEEEDTYIPFIYHAKASKKDRNIDVNGDITEGNKHNTVKPTGLMKYLLKMGLPPIHNAVVLDMFAGSGSTGVALEMLNKEEGTNHKCILVEREEEYTEIIKKRCCLK